MIVIACPALFPLKKDLCWKGSNKKSTPTTYPIHLFIQSEEKHDNLIYSNSINLGILAQQNQDAPTIINKINTTTINAKPPPYAAPNFLHLRSNKFNDSPTKRFAIISEHVVNNGLPYSIHPLFLAHGLFIYPSCQ